VFEYFIILGISLSFLILIFKNNRINYLLLILFASIQLIFTIFISKSFFENKNLLNIFWFINSSEIAKYIFIDKYTVFFMIITSILFFFSSISSISKIIFMKSSTFSLYSSFMILFYISLFGVISSQNIIVLWVFIEATTITGGVLIYQDKTKKSLEAAWKYLFICSIGIAISFVGIIFLSLAYSTKSLSFYNLYLLRNSANHFWLELGFGFILIGFGTKAGLAPTHSWLPDAHSEAPSQVSALLSGALLNTALLGILRVLNILPEEIKKVCSDYLLITGLLSLFISAVFMNRAKNYKRLLAYSSIENIGLISLALSFGKSAASIAYLLIISHSLTKASLFLTSGVIKDLYHTTEIKKVNKLLKLEPMTAITFVLGFLSIASFPLFLSFFAELKLIYFLVESKNWLIFSLVFFLLLVILYALSKVFMNIVFGGEGDLVSSELLKEKAKKLRLINSFQIISALFMILLSLALGIYFPQNFLNFISNL